MIQQASIADIHTVSGLAHQLWPDASPAELQAEYTSLLICESCAVFLYLQESRPIAFAQCQLRHEYVEGTHSSPVGYLEGIFVAAAHRRKRIATELLHHCEQWARARGCSEFASDCELPNTESLRFHLHTGFTEANQIICFTKSLSE